MVDGAGRKVGRPRAQGAGATGPAKEAILLAAAELFASKGYAGTSTREIADRVGIRQPSLFYHFSKKKEILRALVDQAAGDLLSYLPKFEKLPECAAIRLYQLMKMDFLYLMTEPYKIGQLMLLPELRSGDLRQNIERKRNRIIGVYRKLVREGIKEGDFVPSDVNVTTFTIFGMGEAIWTWYRPSRTKSPNKIAEQIADLALRAILREPGKLESIKNSANTRK